MKMIWLSVAQLKNFVSKNVFVFSLFFGGILFSILIFIYSFGNLTPSKFWGTVTDPSYRTMNIYFTETLEMNEEFLYYLDEFGIEDVYVDYFDDDYDIYTSDVGLSVRALRNNDNEKSIVFTPLFEDAQLKEDKTIVSSSYKGDSVDIDGNAYEIAKKVSFMDNTLAFIPIKSFISNQLGVDAIYYVFDDFHSNAEYAEIANIIGEHFPDSEIHPPVNLLEGIEPEDRLAAFTITIIFVIAMCVFLILFNYLVKENHPDYVIYGVVGASKKKIFLSIFFQNMVIFLLSFIVALFIHKGLYAIFDQWLNFYRGITYSFRDYLLIFTMTFFVTTIIEIPFIFKFTSKTLMQMKTQYYK